MPVHLCSFVVDNRPSAVQVTARARLHLAGLPARSLAFQFVRELALIFQAVRLVPLA